MKVLLQHKESKLYLKEVGFTTASAAEAMEFLSSTQAIEFCAMHKIVDMQIVLRFQEQHFDIVLPMIADRRLQGARPSPGA
ncbi:MAG TPA: hypothetical protein PKN95_06345 [Verrucomicrobiota bacterium]|nr:hypothetical protein [Verrucomicrobiota bacterium]HNT15598.1 hypothetical protein [Verrucomicrobiota bacterium]